MTQVKVIRNREVDSNDFANPQIEKGGVVVTYFSQQGINPFGKFRE